MPEFDVAVDVAVAPDTAWAVIRDPCAITRWHPIYVRCHTVRDMRILERAADVKLQERFLGRDGHEDPSVDPFAWMPHDHRAGLASLREYLEDQQGGNCRENLRELLG